MSCLLLVSRTARVYQSSACGIIPARNLFHTDPPMTRRAQFVLDLPGFALAIVRPRAAMPFPGEP
jgi:hypothetical protein